MSLNIKSPTNLSHFTNKVVDDYYHFIVGALSVVVALAWNSAFQNLFDKNKYLNTYGPWAYASILTFIIIILIHVFDIVKKKIYIDLDDNKVPDIII